MADNMMRIAGRDPENGVAKALSVTVDPDGNGVLRTHEAAPWFVFRDMAGNILDPKVDPDGTIRINNSRSRNVAIYNVTLTTVNTEYLCGLPAGTKRFRVTIRDGLATNKYRISWEYDKVATPTAPYLSFTQDKEYSGDEIDMEDARLFLASTVAGAIAQIEAWY